eukprot:TRINITY_DN75239_c0_g1_i1.p1 TRINITY_DN75239_c0_g1~~TRINITY_DN75239_c0_g1_i1.p1  ORF type:complete len:308 (-),score=67.43 TRINITY_DN75239_c0_g1_i1:24-947(-)
MRCSTRRVLFVAQVFIVSRFENGAASRLRHGAHADSQVRANIDQVAEKKAMPISVATAIVDGADMQSILAESAAMEAQADAKALVATQRAAVADAAREQGEKEFEQTVSIIPKAKAALTEARAFAFEAQMHAKHAARMVAELKALPAESATEVVNLVKQQISQAAYSAAEHASAFPNVPTKAETAHMVAKRVADAIEPYHLSLLRAQKAAAEAYAKAQNAAKAVPKLVAMAKQEASQAQALQASQGGWHARQLMTQAHATMTRAAMVKATAERLYAQANDITQSLGNYQQSFIAAAERSAEESATPL